MWWTFELTVLLREFKFFNAHPKSNIQLFTWNIHPKFKQLLTNWVSTLVENFTRVELTVLLHFNQDAFPRLSFSNA